MEMFGVQEALPLSESVAVVGSGPSLVNKGLGKEIDQHACVFRFNGAITKGFSEIVGRKTTHICVGLDLAYFSNFPFIGPQGDVVKTSSKNREQNALLLRGLNPDANIITWAHEQDRAEKNKQHENLLYIREAFPASQVYSWYPERHAEEVKDNYQGNRILEGLGLNTRLDSGKGMRTGFRTILMLVRSNIKPDLYGFDVDTSIKSARHYYDNHISDEFLTHPAHDFLGEMAALIELNLAGLIEVKG